MDQSQIKTEEEMTPILVKSERINSPNRDDMNLPKKRGRKRLARKKDFGGKKSKGKA